MVKATGLGGAVAGTAAGKCRVVEFDASAYDDCPPVDGQDGIIEAGTSWSRSAATTTAGRVAGATGPRRDTGHVNLSL